MIELAHKDVWFITGSQHLYGPETLKQVAANAEKIAAHLNRDRRIPVNVLFKPVVTTSDGIRSVCLDANNDPAYVVPP